VLLLPAAGARGQGRIGDIEVLVQPLPSPDQRSGAQYGACHGYVEYRVRLRNASSKDHTVALEYPERVEYARRDGAVASRTVVVRGGQEALVSLFEPPSGYGNANMAVRVEGEKDPLTVTVGSPRGYQTSELPWLAVLLSRGVPQDFRERGRHASEKEKPKPPAPVALPGMPGSGPGTGGEDEESQKERMTLLRSEVAVSQWSPNWLGYSCYDAILLTEDEAQQMPAPAQMAVRRFIECGGLLLVHGRKVPEAFSRGGVADGKGGYHVGLGRAAASADRGEPTWEKTYQWLVATPREIYHPSGRPSELHDLLVAETMVPVRGLFLLMVLFSAAIGPVNVWLLSKYRKRIWLWWNVPAISLVTCLAVFLYALVSEGWTSRGKTASLTLLDERCHRATTIGYVSLYCPLTPSRGLHFGVETDVALLSREHSWNRYSRYGRREGGPYFVDWTSDQHLASGWVTARLPSYFQFRKNEDRRERLSVEKKADGSVAVVNALGADIRRLYLADASGRVFEGRDIPAGAERTLAPAAGGWKASAAAQAELRRVFVSADWLGPFRSWNGGGYPSTVYPSTILPPGGYVAFLEQSPFVESPLAGADCEDTVAIVCGILKGRDDGR